jgi:hypothetical protein
MTTYVLFKVNNVVCSFPEDCEMVCCSTDLKKIEDLLNKLNEDLLKEYEDEEPEYYYTWFEVDPI